MQTTDGGGGRGDEGKRKSMETNILLHLVEHVEFQKTRGCSNLSMQDVAAVSELRHIRACRASRERGEVPLAAVLR